ncbi:MAG: hypothetical protein ACJAQT_000414 [Akkermansiaceae bacterium]
MAPIGPTTQINGSPFTFSDLSLSKPIKTNTLLKRPVPIYRYCAYGDLYPSVREGDFKLQSREKSMNVQKILRPHIKASPTPSAALLLRVPPQTSPQTS